MPRQKIRKAVIPAAGLGTRFLPATKAVPKELLPIVDTPTIQYIVEEAVAAGVRDVILVCARGKDSIVDHFDIAGELEAHLERTGKHELRARCAPSRRWRTWSPCGSRSRSASATRCSARRTWSATSPSS